MPQTTAKIMPRISSLINGFKNKNDKNAPSGSVIPDQKEYLIALYRLPVEKYSNGNTFRNIMQSYSKSNRYS